jgi:hypothetical protein
MAGLYQYKLISKLRPISSGADTILTNSLDQMSYKTKRVYTASE